MSSSQQKENERPHQTEERMSMDRHYLFKDGKVRSVFVPPPEFLMDPFKKERIFKLFEARRAFSVPSMLNKSNVHNSERIYHAYYVDILNYEAFWFGQVFEQNSEFSEWTVGILGTLATIRRQRGDVEKCLEILELDTKVLKIYLEIVDTSIPEEKACARLLTYKYNLIRINACSQSGIRQTAIEAFREAVQFEIEENYNEDQQNFGFIIEQPSSCGNYMTMDHLNNTSDDYIWSILSSAQHSPLMKVSELKVEVWTCDGCGQKEEMCGDFKRCGACKKACYHSPECQSQHWKIHKKECAKAKKNGTAPKINVDSHSLKDVGNLLVNNFATTVKNHTHKEVTVEQKRAAFPGVVQLLKDFLVSHPHFNCPEAFGDTARDAEMNRLLVEYFQRQQGYEALRIIQQLPHASYTSPGNQDKLVIGEDRIAANLELLIATMNMSLGETVFNDEQKSFFVKETTAEVSKYILEHPEYNSCKGYNEFVENGRFGEVVAEVCTRFAERLGLLDDDDNLAPA